MITTKRAENVINGSYTNENGRQDVALLEREAPKNYYAENEDTLSEKENLRQARERMQRNLDRLLNYDRYAEMEKTEKVAIEEKAAFEVEQSISSVSEKCSNEEDIRPTSTTMQFGDGDVDQMYREMNSAGNAKESYRLNAKGKFFVVLYGLAVAVILALIIINTGVLVSINSRSEQKAAELSYVIGEYNERKQMRENISSDEYVSDIAENQFYMIKQ